MQRSQNKKFDAEWSAEMQARAGLEILQTGDLVKIKPGGKRVMLRIIGNWDANGVPHQKATMNILGDVNNLLFLGVCHDMGAADWELRYVFWSSLLNSLVMSYREQDYCTFELMSRV